MAAGTGVDTRNSRAGDAVLLPRERCASSLHPVSPQCMQTHYEDQNGNKSDELVRVLLLCGDLVAY